MPDQSDPDSAILIESGGFSPSEFRMTLNECKLHVLIAGNDDEAVNYARSILARLVVLLYRPMSDRGSLHTCAEIRGLPNYARVPILLIGPKLDLATRDLAAKIGVNAMLTMPISTLALKQAVLPLLGVAPPDPTMAVEWTRRTEPLRAFGGAKELVDGRRVVDIYRRGSTPNRTNWADRRRIE